NFPQRQLRRERRVVRFGKRQSGHLLRLPPDALETSDSGRGLSHVAKRREPCRLQALGRRGRETSGQRSFDVRRDPCALRGGKELPERPLQVPENPLYVLLVRLARQ